MPVNFIQKEEVKRGKRARRQREKRRAVKVVLKVGTLNVGSMTGSIRSVCEGCPLFNIEEDSFLQISGYSLVVRSF